MDDVRESMGMDEADTFMRQTGVLASIVAHAVAVGVRRAWSSQMLMIVVSHRDDFVYVRGLLPVRHAFMDPTSFERLVTRTVERVHPYAQVNEFRTNVRLQYFQAEFRVGATDV